MLIGKWNLQKQNTVVYVDGTKQSETDRSASDKNISFIQFENDSKFTAISYYNSGGIGSLSLGNVIEVDTVHGTFSFSGSVFKLSTPALAGFTDGVVAGSSGPPPVYHLISQSAQIVQLTTALLTLHTEYIVTETTTADTKTVKNELDYYYTK